ncbi:MAG: DNA-binding response regulator [Chitinophagia bacterium]|nr:DNA-binding response regulator [Chitinophagia bacterium]
MPSPQQPLTCVIVDDEQDAIELLTSRLHMLFQNLQIVATYNQWETALGHLKNSSPDILFMDISIPGKNGFNILNLVPNLTSELIFVTAFEHFALNAFAFAATGYILKPVDDQELSQAVTKAIERVLNKRKASHFPGPTPALNEKIGIPNGTGIDFFPVNDIYYLESNNKCTYITTRTSRLVSTLNIGKFQFLIEQHGVFYQVHRSYIVNINHIARYESSGIVIMTDKNEIPVSRNERAELMQLLSKKFGNIA